MKFQLISYATRNNFGRCFEDAETYFQAALHSLGHEAEYELLDPDFYLIFGWHFTHKWMELPKEKVVIVQLENLVTGNLAERFREEVFQDVRVWDYSPQNRHRLGLAPHQINVFTYGYHPDLDTIRLKKHREFDALFVGSMTPRRKEIMRSLESWAHVPWLFNVFGHKLDTQLARSKVILSPHAYDEQKVRGIAAGYIPASLRIAYALNNGLPVLQEKSSSEADNAYWERFTFVSSKEMFPSTLAIILNQPDEALFRMERWKRETSMTENVRRLVQDL